MSEAEYADELDRWFTANGCAFRCSDLVPSLWQTYHKQGLAPAVAAARISAAAPKGATYRPSTAPQANVPIAGGAPIGGVAPSSAPGPAQAAPSFTPQRADSRFVRKMGRFLYGLGLTMAVIFGLLCVLGFIGAIGAYGQTVRPGDSPAARSGAAMGFFIIIVGPVGAMFAATVAGLVIALLGQLAQMAADFHERHFGPP